MQQMLCKYVNVLFCIIIWIMIVIPFIFSVAAAESRQAPG